MNIPLVMRGAFHDSGNLQGGITMSNQAEYPYVIHLNAFYKPLEVIEEKALADACTHKWENQTLCQVNESVFRMAVIQGEYHWHKNNNDDEFFYVVEGELLIALEGRTVELAPRQRVDVPKAT